MIQEAPGTPKAEQVPLQIRMHPEIRRGLKARAAIEGVTMAAFLHALLCQELGRPDLVDVFAKG